MGNTQEHSEATPYVRVQTPRRASSSLASSSSEYIEAHSSTTPSGPSPLDSANWLSKLTLWWVNPILRHGYTQPLQEADVWRLPHTDTSAVLEQIFDSVYASARASAKQRNLQSASSNPLPPPHVGWPLWHATRGVMVLAVGLHLLSAACTIFTPLVIRELVLWLQGDAQASMLGVTSGYGLCGLLIAATLVSVTALDYGMYLTTRAGLNARMIIVNAVYQKLLKLTTSARQRMTTGDIVTLAGVDADRIFDAYAIGVWTFNSPIMIVTVCILIGFEMGAGVALVALGCSLVTLAYALRNSVQIGKYRRKILAVAGERVKVTNEVLQGIRVVKLYAWEDSIAHRVHEIREREIALLRTYDYLRVYNLVALSMGVTVLTAGCFIVYIARGESLTVATAFTLLAFANVCRMPFGIFSNAVVFASEAVASMARISKFLDAEEIDDSEDKQAGTFEHDSSTIEIRDGAFRWGGEIADACDLSKIEAVHAENLNGETPNGKTDQELTLSQLNVTLPKGSLTIVVGAVGSGKSSLLQAMLGEMHRESGSCAVRGSIAYASQTPWIQHHSVRDNILFGTRLDRGFYDRVLESCELTRDLEILANGDATEIGERGMNLSGGQKARVSLARVMYRKQAEVLLLDDPLSALDVHVANSVFTKCILGLVAKKTRVLVLNAHYHLLEHADRILLMEKGQIIADGTFADVVARFPYLAEEAQSQQEADSTEPTLIQESPEEEAMPAQEDPTRESFTFSETPETMERVSLVRHASVASSLARHSKKTQEEARGRKAKPDTMMLEEDRNTGSMGWQIYSSFLGSSGYNGNVLGALIFLVFAIGQGVLVGSDYFVTYWSNGSMSATFSQQSLLWLYLGIVVVGIAMFVIRSVFFTEVCVRASQRLHQQYFGKVLRAPVTTFFDVTPVGRILNRFSRDLDQIDNPLPYYGMSLLTFGLVAVSIFVVCAVTTPYTLILYAPLFGACYYVQVYFLASARELKRMDGVTRSPYLNLVTETINGMESIRSFGMTRAFAKRCHLLLDNNAKFFFLYQTASKWFALRLDWLVALVVSVVSILCVASRDSIGAASAGIALTYAIQLTTQFQRLLTLWSMTENFMTSYERISFYETLDQEDADGGVSSLTGRALVAPSSNWPTRGSIDFDKVSVRYREGLDLVLTRVSFSIQPGEKIGVCGRTGSGKSTLMSALFRVVECTEGVIRIDGVDIASMSVNALRSRLTIIPQDPVLFSGPLRFNLDPFDQKTDAELWQALRNVQLADQVTSWGQGLAYEIAEKGDNLSVGQRQLVCIARALLRASRIIVLDEATANVDQELDRAIQQAVQQNFRHQTTMTIAHRLETISSSDRILVLDNGLVQEFDSPANLMANPSGMFASLMRSASGSSNSQETTREETGQAAVSAQDS